MTIEEMNVRKRELGLSSKILAQLSGIPFSTVYKIFSGPTGGTWDFNEMNDICCPQLRGLDSYYPMDAPIPMALEGGVTTVATGPDQRMCSAALSWRSSCMEKPLRKQCSGPLSG